MCRVGISCTFILLLCIQIASCTCLSALVWMLRHVLLRLPSQGINYKILLCASFYLSTTGDRDNNIYTLSSSLSLQWLTAVNPILIIRFMINIQKKQTNTVLGGKVVYFAFFVDTDCYSVFQLCCSLLTMIQMRRANTSSWFSQC